MMAAKWKMWERPSHHRTIRKRNMQEYSYCKVSQDLNGRMKPERLERRLMIELRNASKGHT